jgi:cell division protein FtsB
VHRKKNGYISNAMDFYRSLAPRKLVKKALKHKRSTLVILGAFVLFLYLLFDNKGIVKRIQLEMESTRMKEKVAQIEKQNEHLQAQAKALEGDKKTIEKTARERYGMARKGETVYRVKKD